MTTEKRVSCPSCGTSAKRVRPVTLQALLKQECVRQFNAGDQARDESNSVASRAASGDAGWRFCGAQGCDVVYFSEHGETTFTKSQLKVAVGVKETTGDRPLCYCFNHSVATIQEELQSKGRSDALADIRAKMKDPGCHCEISNPSGSCCLGDVTKGIQLASNEVGASDVLPARSATMSTIGS